MKPSVPARERFQSRYTPIPIAGCWVWDGALVDGYGHIQTGGNAGRTIELAHRLSWKLHVGEIPAGMSVLHECDVRCCVNPAHLFLGTNLDNVRDRVQKKRSAKGDKHSRAQLTEDQVIAIRADKRPTALIAESYGVSYFTVWMILRRKSWRHLP